MNSNKEALKSLETERSAGNLEKFSNPDLSNTMSKGKMMNMTSADFILGNSKTKIVKKSKSKMNPSASAR